jgi:photosystem II stability/assembly factor-like uncharacterized protein
VSDWEQLSARPGGTVAALATAGSVHIFAATMAGVYQSVDAGSSWSATGVHAGLPFCEAIAASADSGHDQALHVGGRNGLYRSQDSGRTWRQTLAGGRVMSLALSPGVLLVGTEQDGVLRSEDRGDTFDGSNAGLLELTILALALSPEFERDGTGFAATPSGLYRTRNGGKSWRALEVDTAVQCLALSRRFAEDHTVFAGTESAGLLRSSDAGAHWETVPTLSGGSVTALAFSTRATIAAATDTGVAVSSDGGGTWRTIASDFGAVLTLAFAPNAGSEVLVAGLHRNGVARAVEPFERWTLANDGLNARLLVGLALSPAFAHDRRLFAVGPDDGLMMSANAGLTWTSHVVQADAPAQFAVAVSPDFARDRLVFAASEAGVLRSRDAGATWEPTAHDSACAVLAAAPHRPDENWRLVVAQTNRLLASEDAGDTWWGMGEPFNGDIVSVSRGTEGTWFVGSVARDERTLWRSVDDGLHWERLLVERDGDLLPIAISAGYALDETVYVGAASRVLAPMRNAREVRHGERRPIWRSVDLGAQIAALATPADPENSRLVFAATSTGVYVSRDAGEHFNAWHAAAGPDATVALAVSPNYARDRLVYALEVGGRIWRRRDAQG